MRPLRLVFLAFAASALLIVLQTVLYQLLPYDSSAADKVALGLRVGFLLADVVMLVALIDLARAERMQRGLLVVGASLSAFASLSGLLGLASALGPDARILRDMGRAASGAEPILSIGTTILVTLTLGALAKPHGSKATSRASLVTVAVAISVLVAFGFRAVRLVDPTPRSLPAAWASWLVEVSRPALVAWLALSLVRAVGRAAKIEARAEGPYRAAGEGAPAPATKEPFDAATLDALRNVGRALGSYRLRFAVRVGLSIPASCLAIVAASMRHNSDGALVMLAVPGASLATSVLLVLSLRKLLVLPRGVRARGVTLGALGALGVAALVDAAVLLFGVSSLFDQSSYRAGRDLMSAVFTGWPVVALASGVSLLFVASALRRLGERLENDAVVSRARAVQGIAIGAGAAQIGATLAALQAKSAGGGVVTAGLIVAALGATVAVVVLHLLLVGAARAAILVEVGEAARAPRAG